MREASVGAALSPSIEGFLSWNEISTVATFRPIQELTPDTTYTFTILEAKDVAGNPVTGTTQATFTVGSNNPDENLLRLPLISSED
jgi:hypothetical protein